MLDLNPTHMKRADAVKDIHERIDAALQSRENKRRDYVGASGIGSGCERRLQYEFLGTAYDAEWSQDPRTQRIFDRGHHMEELAVKWLHQAGYWLKTADLNNKQLGFSVADGRFKGHIDGVIQRGPGIDEPCIWEHKAVGAKSWRSIEKNGVAKAKPEYADQIAIYQAYMNLEAPALFQATNMDTMELYFEWVPFDKKRAQEASDRAVDIIRDSEAGALRARVSDDPEFFMCRSCQFRSRCHV